MFTNLGGSGSKATRPTTPCVSTTSAPAANGSPSRRTRRAPYFEKPPLYMWLTALTYDRVPGFEAKYRFWSALFGVACVALTGLLGGAAAVARGRPPGRPAAAHQPPVPARTRRPPGRHGRRARAARWSSASLCLGRRDFAEPEAGAAARRRGRGCGRAWRPASPAGSSRWRALPILAFLPCTRCSLPGAGRGARRRARPAAARPRCCGGRRLPLVLVQWCRFGGRLHARGLRPRTCWRARRSGRPPAHGGAAGTSTWRRSPRRRRRSRCSSRPCCSPRPGPPAWPGGRPQPGEGGRADEARAGRPAGNGAARDGRHRLAAGVLPQPQQVPPLRLPRLPGAGTVAGGGVRGPRAQVGGQPASAPHRAPPPGGRRVGGLGRHAVPPGDRLLPIRLLR